MPFIFKDFNYLTDGEIDLILIDTNQAVPEKNYVPRYIFKITLHKDDEEIGKIDIRIGDNENTWFGGHLGYYIDPKFRGNSYASKACKILKKVAKKHEMPQLYISCNPDNQASRKTAEKSGFHYVKTVELPENNDLYQMGERKACIYRLDLKG